MFDRCTATAIPGRCYVRNSPDACSCRVLAVHIFLRCFYVTCVASNITLMVYRYRTTLYFFREGSVGASLASEDLPLGHRLLPLLTERSGFSLVSSFTFFFCTKYDYSRSQLSSAWFISSAQLSSAPQRCLAA